MLPRDPRLSPLMDQDTGRGHTLAPPKLTELPSITSIAMILTGRPTAVVRQAVPSLLLLSCMGVPLLVLSRTVMALSRLDEKTLYQVSPIHENCVTQ